MDVNHASFQERILADLDDDAWRAVYADKLQEAGDPRGELIALSLVEARGSATPKQLRRIQALVRENRTAWFGALPKVCNGLRFERGFLERVTFKASIGKLSPEEVAAALDHPELRFVRELESVWNDVHRTLRLAPALRSVRDISFPMDDVATALLIASDRHPRSWKTLRAGNVLVNEEVFDAVAGSLSLRSVESMSVRVWPDDLAALVDLARRFQWPTADVLRTLHLELGAGFDVDAERNRRLRASGVDELAAEVTWSTPYGTRGRIHEAAE